MYTPSGERAPPPLAIAVITFQAYAMAEPSTSSESQPRGRGRGRGKSRGGLGKYLRARGRGHSFGRPAQFTTRLVLEGEEPDDLDPEEAKEIHQRYAKRQLASNADRYVEEEPQLDSEGAWHFILFFWDSFDAMV